MAQGQRKLLQMMLERRFGPLSPAVGERLDTYSSEKLTQLAMKLLDARSLRELGLEESLVRPTGHGDTRMA